MVLSPDLPTDAVLVPRGVRSNSPSEASRKAVFRQPIQCAATNSTTPASVRPKATKREKNIRKSMSSVKWNDDE